MFRQRSDAELVQAVLRARSQAFEALISRHHRKARAIALASGARPDTVPDVLQDAFLQAFQKLQDLRNPESFGPWLLSIVRNGARMSLRRSDRSLQPLPPEGPAKTGPDSCEESELRNLLWQKVEELPEGTREAIFLYYHEGESVKGVAAALGTTPSIVKDRLRHGRDVLREKLWRDLRDYVRDLIPSTRERKKEIRQLSLLVLSGLVPGAATAAGTGTGVVEAGSISASAGLSRGVVAMSLKKLSMAAAACIVLALGVVLVVREGNPPIEAPDNEVASRNSGPAGVEGQPDSRVRQSGNVPLPASSADIGGQRSEIPQEQEDPLCQVVEEGGRPVARAEVAVYREGSIAWEGVTDLGGVFLLDAAARPELIVVTADGYVSVTRRPQEPPPYRIVLRRGGTISGQVVDVTTGLGLDGFGIVLKRTDVLTSSLPFGPDRPDGTLRREVFTNAEGYFEAKGLSPSSAYAILDGGKDPTHVLIQSSETYSVPVGTVGVLLRAARFRLLRVHLFDLATSRPAGGVGVEVAQPEPGGERQRTILVKTTVEGIADFSRMCFAGTCIMKINHPGYREVRRELPGGVDEVEPIELHFSRPRGEPREPVMPPSAAATSPDTCHREVS